MTWRRPAPVPGSVTARSQPPRRRPSYKGAPATVLVLVLLIPILLLSTGAHAAATGHRPASSDLPAPPPPAPPSWRECAERALASLRPPVRHGWADAAVEEGAPAAGPAHHIARTRAQLASLASAACPAAAASQPTLVFTTVGGFGDRLKGMVTAYYAALLTHAHFRVAWTVPSPIAPYFDISPAVLWGADGPQRLADAGPAFDPFATHLVIPGAKAVDAVDIPAFFTDPASDFVASLAPPANGSVTLLRTNVPCWLEVVRRPSLRAAAALYGLADLTRRDLFVLAVHALLRRPSPGVVEAAAAALPHPLREAVGKSLTHGFDGAAAGGAAAGRRLPDGSVARPGRRRGATAAPAQRAGHGPTVRLQETARSPAPALVGVQIRTGGVGEAWSDSEHRHPVHAARCFADQAKAWCTDVYGGACVVFLTADSRAATLAFVGALNGTGIAVTQTSGRFLHTDRGVPADARATAGAAPTRLAPRPADPWLKTYADWAALSQADVLLMSHSGYGLTAAWTGGVPHVRQLHKGGACEWARLDECAELPR